MLEMCPETPTAILLNPKVISANKYQVSTKNQSEIEVMFTSLAIVNGPTKRRFLCLLYHTWRTYVHEGINHLLSGMILRFLFVQKECYTGTASSQLASGNLT